MLGSGGARGYAHIGASEVHHDRGYEIVAVSGCSMGALGRHLTAKALDEHEAVVAQRSAD